MIGPMLGELLRGLIGGLCGPPIFWLAWPGMLLWTRWSLARFGSGGLMTVLGLAEIVALGMLVVGGGAAISDLVANRLGVPTLAYDATHLTARRHWSADVVLYGIGMLVGMGAMTGLACSPPFRRSRLAWQALVARLEP
ncbi:hypothetical protein [Luteimonas sp. FCS-9]|uniref:hypothetical protein n=1 Tax=Luteimonas sp. FCS-9 TaxID=1547516 RepID=UPI00063E73A8|nr:hypothetical protein [Luteimonas sp. FCS-9]KLI97537.1 hypothetical protein WQ56_16870 [Luteimonas sp. FCS-9]